MPSQDQFGAAIDAAAAEMRTNAQGGGGVAVADEDPFSSAINAAAKEVNSPKTPPVRPFSTIPTPGGTLTEQAAKLGQPSPTTDIPLTPTIGPRTPTLGERVRNVFTFGAPPGSIAGNISGKVLQPGDEQREPQLITPEAAMTPTEQTQHPVLTGAGQLIGGLTSLPNVALMLGSGGLGAMPGVAGRILPRLVSGVFSAQMLKGAYDQYPQFRAAVDRGDYSEAKRIGTLILGGAAMGAAAGRHALKGSAVPVEQNISQAESATATAPGEEAVASPTTSSSQQTPQPEPAPTTIGAGEQLHPERPETLKAQVDALQGGTNKAVYFPKGQANIPEPPENANVTVVKGNKPGAGTWYHTDDVAPEQIRASVKDGSYAKLLGFTQLKEEAAANGKPTTVVARDGAGTELKAGLVDATNPQAVAEQAAEFTKQFPNSRIGVERPEDVIAKRQGVPTKEENEGQEGPVSRETPQQESPLQATAHDPHGVGFEPLAATLPVGEFVPKLTELSDKLRDSDPELSAHLTGLANGDPAALDGLRKYAQEKMSDEQAKPLIAAVDAAAEESKQAGTQEFVGNGNEPGTAEAQRPAETANVAGHSETSGSQVGPESVGREESPISASRAEVPGVKKAPRKPRIKKITDDEIAAEVYKPGNVIRGYGRNYDKVLEFRPGDPSKPYPENDWRVKVIGSDKDGTPLPGEYARMHHTMPEKEEFNAARKRIEQRRAEAAVSKVKNEPETAAHDHILEAMRRSSEPEENFKTNALDRLIGKPVREAGKEASVETEGKEVPEGTFNTGLNPVAAVKRLVPESVREKVGDEVEANQRARRLQGGLYDLDSQNAADVLRARDVLKEAPGTPKDQEAIYHHLEDPTRPLTGTQRSILNDYLQPILDESERINEKLGGGQVENYVHRIPIGKGSRLERIMGGESKLTGGSGLSKSAGATKGRVMMALEDEQGERRVVAIKKGQVTAFDNGNAEHLGRIRGLETQGLKTKGELLAREIEPMQRELEKLEAERRTLTATKSREAASLRRIANIDDREAELRDAIQGAHRSDEGQLLSENDLRDRVFVDKNGKQWKITQATTREIEANTNQRYYKNALASSVMNFLNIRKAERAFDFLESYKSSPDFKEVAAKVSDGAAPAGWRTTDLPQFHGYVFEPHTAEVLDWYSKRMHAEGPNLYRQVGDFLRTAIFFNPLIHTPNIGVHWLVEKGLTGVGPQNWGRILRTGSKAIDAVIHQNQDFLDALDEGAPLQSPRLERDAATKLLIDRMGRELDANPTAAQKVAKALGYANPAKLVRAIYKFSGKATWVTNDVAMLQATYEHMERTGQSFKEAVTDVSKHIPDYRLPTRIFNSPSLAKLMSNPDLTMFGAYHYGALRSYGEMAKGLISEDVPHAERLKSLDRLAMLGLVTFVAYPQLDKLAKLLTGDKTAEFRRAGASTFIWNLAQLAKGNRAPTEVLESVATPAVHTKAAVELALNRNLYSGRKIYDTSALAGDIAKQVGRYAAQAVSPIQQALRVAGGRQTIPQFVAGLAGIRTKVKTPAEKLASTLAIDRSPLGPGNEDQRQANALARSYEEKIRNGKIPTQELGKAISRGELTEEQAVKIFRNSKTSPLERDFKQLPIDDALKVWNKASTDERKTLRPILEGKVWNLDRDNYTDGQWTKLRDRVRTALTGQVPTQPIARIPGMRIPVTPPAMGAGARQ